MGLFFDNSGTSPHSSKTAPKPTMSLMQCKNQLDYVTQMFHNEEKKMTKILKLDGSSHYAI